MADRSYIQSLLGGLDTNTKRALIGIFDYLLKNNLRVGRPDADTPSVNLAGHFYTATTPASANAEFTIPHRFNAAPYLLIPVLPLDGVNTEIVPLKVTRAADASRLYLSSSATSTPICVYVEGA